MRLLSKKQFYPKNHPKVGVYFCKKKTNDLDSVDDIPRVWGYFYSSSVCDCQDFSGGPKLKKDSK